MRTIRFLLLILLSLTVTCTWADIIPVPGDRDLGPETRTGRRSRRKNCWEPRWI